MAFPVNRSTPAASALADYVPTVYDLGVGDNRRAPHVACFFAGEGWCDVYMVEVRTSRTAPPVRYFLKVYAPDWRSKSDILFELDFIRHLSCQGISVALPRECRDGSLLCSLDLPEGERSMALFDAAPGRPLSEQPSEVQSRILGRLAARLHDAAEQFSSPHPRRRLDLERLLDLSPLEQFASQRTEE